MEIGLVNFVRILDFIYFIIKTKSILKRMLNSSSKVFRLAEKRFENKVRGLFSYTALIRNLLVCSDKYLSCSQNPSRNESSHVKCQLLLNFNKNVSFIASITSHFMILFQ
jgi:hypothetical protein